MTSQQTAIYPLDQSDLESGLYAGLTVEFKDGGVRLISPSGEQATEIITANLSRMLPDKVDEIALVGEQEPYGILAFSTYCALRRTFAKYKCRRVVRRQEGVAPVIYFGK